MRIRVERSSLESGESELLELADELESLRSQLRSKISGLEYESQRRGDVDGTVRELEQEMNRLKERLEDMARFVAKKGKDFQFADDQGKPIKKSFWDFLKKIISAVLDFIPIVSNIKGLIESVFGHDLFTGEKLSATERALGIMGPFGKGAKLGAKIIKHLDDPIKLTKKVDKAKDASRSVDRGVPPKSSKNTSQNPKHEVNDGAGGAPSPMSGPLMTPNMSRNSNIANGGSSSPIAAGGSGSTVLTGRSAASGSSKLEPNKLNKNSTCGDPVHAATGAQIIEHELFIIPSARSWKLSLQYNTLLLQRGTLGMGWTHNYETRLVIEPSGEKVTLWLTNATHHVFERVNAPAEKSGHDSGQGADTESEGIASRLSLKLRSNSAGEFRSGDGDAYYDRLYKQPDGTYKLIRHSHEVMVFDKDGRLLYVEEEGQRLLAEHSRDGQLSKLTDEISGRTISFKYNDRKLVETVKDSSGREVKLAYNERQQLIRIVHPNDHVTTFTYSDKGPIASAMKGNDVVFINEFDDQLRVVRQQEGRGNWFHFHYDVDSRPGMVVTRFTDREGHETVLVHDSSYRLIEKTDPHGYTTRWQYDEYGNCTQFINALGQVASFQYDENGRLVQITDPSGAIEQYTYNEAGYVSSHTDASGALTEFERDEFGRLLKRKDALGQQVSITYDERGLVQSYTDESAAKTLYTYDERGDLVVVLDAEGRKYAMQYDNAGHVASMIYPDGGEWKYAYDEVGNLLCEIDPLYRMRTYQYDTMGQLVRATDASGATESYTYDANGNLTSWSDALGATTSYQYDKEERLVQELDPTGVKLRYAYDEIGQLVQVRQGDQVVLRYRYDELGRTTETIDAYGNSIERVAYDEVARTITVKNALGAVTRHAFNALGQRTETVDPIGHRLQLHSDALGRIVHVIEADRAETRFEYDAAGRVKAYLDAAGNRSAYEYDRTGRVVREVRATKDEVSFSYDAAGRLERRVDPSGRVTRLSYDQAGQLIEQADEAGTIRYVYDVNGRVTEVEETRLRSDNVRTSSNAVKNEAGNTAASDPASSTAASVRRTLRRYDALGRVVAYTDVYGNEIQYAYDFAGRLIELTYPDGKVVQYRYDAVGRLAEVKDWAQRLTTYEYDANGRLIRTVRPNGTVEKREYDVEGQLTLLADQSAQGILLQRFRIEYDAGGQVVREEEKQYTYDQLKRLVSGAEQGRVTHYRYDKMGNITNVAVAPTPSAATDNLAEATEQSFRYGADNRLAAVDNLPVEVDANGNLLYATDGKQVHAYAYDARNRLVEAGALRYDYDAEGHRIATHITTNGQIRIVRHVVNPHDDLSQLLMETDEEGKPLAYYVYGLGLIGREDSRGYKSYHADMRGSTTLLTDEQGKVTDRYRYGLYGEVEHTEGTTPQPFQYNGRDGVITDLNGLYDMRNRFYNPTLKRFLQRDVWSGRLNETQSLNRYAYVQGNPAKYIDPLGLAKCNPGPELKEKKNKILDGTSEVFKSKEPPVTYYRVQGGTPPNASWERIHLKDDNIRIDKNVNVNISTGDMEHAKYFLKEKRPGGYIVAFDVPKEFDDMVKKYAVPQMGYKTNPANQGGAAPKIVDPSTPGDSYEFPPYWSKMFEKVGRNGRKITTEP